jgi:RNA polymerase sigma-70 factor (ECF subfamily)
MGRSPDGGDSVSELFLRARAGEGAALDRIVGLYQARLLARIRLMMGPEARCSLESGDVLQEVFADAIRGLRAGDLRDERAFLRWVTAIARNHIVDEVRKRREESLEALSSELAGREPSAAACVSTDEARQRLVEALEELDPVRQRVVELRSLDGLSWASIAIELGRSEEAARKLYNRALIELGERLRRVESDGR